MSCVVRFARQLCKSLGLGSYPEQAELLCAEASAAVLGFDAETVSVLSSEFAIVFAETSGSLMNP